jgi:hypothetical protein
MNDLVDTTTTPATAAPTPSARALSKRQIKAAEMENEYLMQKRWKLMLPDAKTAWAKVPAEDLAKAKGNVHVLAGLVQLRYHTSREDADQQVRQFLLQHPSAAEPASTLP